MGGKLHSLDLDTRQWAEPIPVPGFMDDFAYMGGSTAFQGVGVWALSTLATAPVYDRVKNTLTLANDRGYDGKPHNFMDKQLVFDPSDQSFGYIRVEHGEDTYPLLCYQTVANGVLVITGTDIWGYRNEVPGYTAGKLVVMQSAPAVACH
jgi:hypothetical protein